MLNEENQNLRPLGYHRDIMGVYRDVTRDILGVIQGYSGDILVVSRVLPAPTNGLRQGSC